MQRGRRVEIVAVQVHAAGLVAEPADAEVVLAVALVDELGPQVFRIAEPVVDAAEEQRLRQRHGQVGRLRRIRAARAEQRDVVLADLLDRSEEVRLVLDDRSAGSRAVLLRE